MNLNWRSSALASSVQPSAKQGGLSLQQRSSPLPGGLGSFASHPRQYLAASQQQAHYQTASSQRAQLLEEQEMAGERQISRFKTSSFYGQPQPVPGEQQPQRFFNLRKNKQINPVQVGGFSRRYKHAQEQQPGSGAGSLTRDNSGGDLRARQNQSPHNFDGAMIISGINAPPQSPPQVSLPLIVKQMATPEEYVPKPRPLLQALKPQAHPIQSLLPPKPKIKDQPPLKKIVPPLKPLPDKEPPPVQQDPPKKKKSPKKKKEVSESEWEYDDEDEADKEKERLRRLRLMNRRAHRGFSQAEIMMMRWQPAPKENIPLEDQHEWACQLCQRLISGTIGAQPQNYLELKCRHRFHMQCLEVWFMRENFCSACELQVLLTDVI